MDGTNTGKILIGGLRFSTEQVLASLPGIAPDCHDFISILGRLAEEKINLPFLCLHTVNDRCAAVCVSRKDFDQFRPAADAEPPFGRRAELIPSTGSLTLFPHQSRLRTLGVMLEIFAENRLSLYSLCSSLSALLINTDFCQLERAAQALQASFQLPDNHAPFRQQTKYDKFEKEISSGNHPSVLETAAVYWEPVIKIYGSSIKKDLLLTTAHLTQNKLSRLGKELQAVESGRGIFEMALMQRLGDNAYKLGLLYESRRAKAYRLLFSSSVDLFSGVEHRNAELLYLHGPHFHERYGVASAALGSLQDKGCELFAVGCSGTSIYIIVPEKKGQRSVEALEKIFIVPKLS